jgi:hypothetical protein
MEDAESLAQGAVERLSEDESLRGDLTDEGFSPLLNWAANAAIAYAQNLQSDKPEDAMDQYASRLKTVMQAVVADAQAGKIEDYAELLGFLSAPSPAAQARLQSLKLGQDADANAVEITNVLSELLNTPPTTGSSATPPEAAQVTPATPATTSGSADSSSTPAADQSPPQAAKPAVNDEIARKQPEPEKKVMASKSGAEPEKKVAAPKSEAAEAKISRPKPDDKAAFKPTNHPGETRQHADRPSDKHKFNA